MAYATLAQLKAELGITTTTDDTLLTGYLTTAQDIIESPPPLGTGRVFEASSDSTRTVDVPLPSTYYRPTLAGRNLPSPLLMLDVSDAGDLASITSVTNGDGASVSASDYVTLPRQGGPITALQLKAGGDTVWTYTTSPEGAVSITGKWAYSVSPPDAIVRACLRLAVWMYRSKDNAGADQPIQTERGIILPTALPLDVRLILESYRRGRAGGVH